MSAATRSVTGIWRTAFAFFNAGVGANACDLVAIGLAFGGFIQIEQRPDKGWDLDALIPKARRPFRDVFKRIKRGVGPCELGQKNCWPFDL